jgi:hypothetical protein
MVNDLTGMKFGLLTVQAKTERGWCVRCDCGKEKTVRAYSLIHGRTKSCGCASQVFKKTKMGKRFNLVNQRFGRLWVLWRAGSKQVGRGSNAVWECRCDCGNVIKTTARSLRSGKKKSCGCLTGFAIPGRLKDLQGQRFGKLVIGEFHSFNKTRNAKWNAVCDCGKPCIVLGYQLSNGRTKSCGCLKAENQKLAVAAVRLPLGIAARNQVLSGYKQKAGTIGREWALTDEQFDLLVKSNCYYCGSAPTNRRHGENYNGDFVYNGLDRRKSTVGYTPENVVACCWTCNWMKRNLTEEVFLRHVEKIHGHKNALAIGVGR